MPAYAPLEPTFRDIRRIAVLRGGGLGDLLFAMPAISAFAAAYPDAELVLLGTPMHAELLSGRPGPVARVEVLPDAPGIREAGGAASEPVDDFVARLRRHRFDLAVQLHGGGRNSNPFLLRLGARHTVGSATEDAAPLERTLPYVYYQHEVVRGLEVAGLAGAAPVDLEPAIEVLDEERRSADALLGPLDGPLVVVHPGATDPRRRWPVERFAHVVGALLDDGAEVALVGDPSDRRIEAELASSLGASGGRLHRLAGRSGLGETAAVFERAAVVVANDSGPRHLAQAVGAATVGIFWFGNVVNAAPFGRGRHRVHLSFTTRCPVCGTDVTQVGWTADRCEHDVSFVDRVDADAVLADARQIMARTSPRRGTPGAPAPRIRVAG
ncbi:glycosyltransferase family 9 protein [Agromyces indicus]|uniref:Glycosyltransferase family 9 protein n=1 Tax=Agromyces indicus TaxID=758919 RepID=A0ABU1FK49_9MICO|nr:glycosyltransferase family 9 protein [Agromyces indicus]MDR5692135.1 glycosyltransferase family 9 protein [Agromyces indicus]